MEALLVIMLNVSEVLVQMGLEGRLAVKISEGIGGVCETDLPLGNHFGHKE